jgi:hypothetical protein
MYWLLLAPALLVLGLAAVTSNQPAAVAICLSASAVLVATAYSFRHLRVVDEGDALAVRFGPIPVFGKRVLYRDIQSAERDQSMVADGWGIHWFPGRGWTYNLWGFDCVRVTLNSGATLRIGTDDPDALARFLNEKRLTSS